MRGRQAASGAASVRWSIHVCVQMRTEASGPGSAGAKPGSAGNRPRGQKCKATRLRCRVPRPPEASPHRLSPCSERAFGLLAAPTAPSAAGPGAALAFHGLRENEERLEWQGLRTVVAAIGQAEIENCHDDTLKCRRWEGARPGGVRNLGQRTNRSRKRFSAGRKVAGLRRESMTHILHCFRRFWVGGGGREQGGGHV